MFMALTNSLVVLFIAVLLQIFEETFTAMLLVLHCCGMVYLGNSQVSVYRTIGPTLVSVKWMFLSETCPTGSVPCVIYVSVFITQRNQG